MPEGIAAQCGWRAAKPASRGGAGATTGIDVPAKNAMMHNLVVELLRKQYSALDMALKERVG